MHRRVDRVHATVAILELGRNAGVVDQRVQLAAMRFQPMADFRDRNTDIFLIGEVDLDVVFRPCRPWAILGKGLARTGDDTPTLARKALDRGMADTAAGAGQHYGFSGVEFSHVAVSGRRCSRTVSRRREAEMSPWADMRNLDAGLPLV